MSAKDSRGEDQRPRRDNVPLGPRDKRPVFPSAKDDAQWNEYCQKVRAVVIGIIGGTEIDVKDIVQDVMEKAWRWRETFKGDSRLETWIFRIAVNTALDARRKIHKNVSRLDDITIDQDGTPYGALEPSAPIVDVHRVILANELLQRLSHNQAETVRRWMNDDSAESIGQEYGLSGKAVRKRVSRAIRQLVALNKEQRETETSIASRKPPRKTGMKAGRAGGGQQ